MKKILIFEQHFQHILQIVPENYNMREGMWEKKLNS